MLELISLCENSLKYEEALNLAESERYREAIEVLEELGNFTLVNYRFDYDNLEYTGTALKWEAVFMPHTLNISTGTMTYTDNFSGKDWTFKESYVHSK